MKKSKITIFNQITEGYGQFKTMSLLYDEIVKVLECSLSEAKYIAATHCNLVSFWIILKSSMQIDKSYANFYKICLNKNLCNKEGYIYDKPAILKEFGVESDLTTYREFEDILDPIRLNPDKFYQVKIKANTSGFHFMACYIDDGFLYLSDTSYRGIGVKALDHINKNNFQKISEVC